MTGQNAGAVVGFVVNAAATAANREKRIEDFEQLVAEVASYSAAPVTRKDLTADEIETAILLCPDTTGDKVLDALCEAVEHIHTAEFHENRDDHNQDDAEQAATHRGFAAQLAREAVKGGSA